MALTPDELKPADRAILKMLRDGRANAPYIADETGYATGTVRNHLRKLREEGHVRKLAGSLHELANDPEPPADDTELSFTPARTQSISYGPSSRENAAFVLRVGTSDGPVRIHLDEDQMYELWTEVQHTPWPNPVDEQEKAGELRQRLVDLAIGADADMLRDALNAIDPRWGER